MKLIKRSMLLLMVLIVAACSNSVNTLQNNDANVIFEANKNISASFVNASLPSMKGVAENEYLQLLIDVDTAAIGIVNKSTGAVWHSNPVNSQEDMIASGINKDMLAAQLKLDYYNSFGQLSSINTYTDSIKYEQIAIEHIENGVSVSYKFGTEVRTFADLPQRLSKARFDEISAQLDKAGQRALLIGYKEDKENGYFDRNDSALQGLQLERALNALDSIGYSTEDLARDAQEHNIEQVKEEARVFFATIEYMLDEKSLVARVPVDKIIFPDDYPVNVVSVLPFLGAGGLESKGSLFVPDGSGALIHFNNGKQKYAAYQQSVYGEDMTTVRTENINTEQKVRLPVFGMINGDDAWLGIVEDGAAVAAINADISGRLNSYNVVYPSFSVVNKGDITLIANEQKRTLPKFQESPMKSDFVVRYVFVDKKKATYTDLAHTYQNYLLQKKMLAEQSTHEQTLKPTFYLDLVGNIQKEKYFLGIPYQSQQALTSFEQAETIVDKLAEHNVAPISLRYTGWFNGGVNHRIPEKIKVDTILGGKLEMNKLIENVSEKDVTVYPDVALAIAHSDDNFTPRKDASRSLRETPALFYPVDLALEGRDRSKQPSYVISPKNIEGLAETTIKYFNKQQIQHISLRDLGDVINSDYLKHEQLDRTESESITVSTLQQLHDAQLNLLVDGGNANTFSYAKQIVNAPMSSSGFKITDESIPFYQMVISGYIDYTGTPFNLSTYFDKNEYILKLLEYGSGIHFKWIYANNDSVKDTDHNNLYALNYELWLDDAKSIFTEVSKFYEELTSKKIIDHQKLQSGVYKTTYEHGQYVIVNYNHSRVTVDGRKIEALGYMTGGESDVK